MSLRLDPRRLGLLKQLAGETGARPGDLVRQWVEERIDAERLGAPASGGIDLASRLRELEARIAGLEAQFGTRGVEEAPPADGSTQVADAPVETTPAAAEPKRRRAARKAASASPAERVALHDEMIAVLQDSGPMSSSELAAAIAERGRYRPPRSGKALDAATVSQRASNPTYRARFTRREGRIGLAESAE